MRLLDLVEQDDGVRAPADGLGELTGLVVADVSGRRADHPRHGVLLLVLRHVDADHRVLVVEQELGERARQLGLADAGRAEEDEAAERPVRILQSGARAADGVGHGDDRLVLADDALVEALLHVNQLLDFAFHQPADRDVGPLGDDLGDVLLVDFFLEHPLALLHFGEAGLLLLDLPLELGQLAVLQLGRLRVVARSLRLLDLETHALELFFHLSRALDGFLLLLPVRLQARLFLLQVGELLFELAQALDARPCPSPCAAPRARSRAA